MYPVYLLMGVKHEFYCLALMRNKMAAPDSAGLTLTFYDFTI